MYGSQLRAVPAYKRITKKNDASTKTYQWLLKIKGKTTVERVDVKWANLRVISLFSSSRLYMISVKVNTQTIAIRMIAVKTIWLIISQVD